MNDAGIGPHDRMCQKSYALFNRAGRMHGLRMLDPLPPLAPELMQNLDDIKAARINGRVYSTRMRLAPVLARPLKNVKSIATKSNFKDIAALAPVRYCKLEDFKVSPLCGFFASICSPRAVHRVQPLEDVEVTALGGIPARVPAESGVTVHVHPPQLVQISPSRQSVGESVQPSSPPAFLQSLAVSVHAVELLLGQVLKDGSDRLQR